MFVKHDVTSLADWTKVIELTEEKFGPVSILVNNAGVLGPIAQTADLTEADYQKVCSINQHAVFYGMKACLN